MALLGYWLVTSLLNKKKTSSHKTFNSDTENNSNHNKTGQQHSNNNSSEKDYIIINWFIILEVSEDANKDEIISAYKKRILKYHPDKVSNMGPEIREIAEQKSKQINLAYNYALKFKNK